MNYVNTNLNYGIKVKLTKAGKQIYRDYYDNDPPTLSVDEDGYATFQIHAFMNIFGEYLHMGTVKMPCETNIQIQYSEKYRPFNNTDELIDFWSEKENPRECPYIWVKEKETGNKELITGYAKETVLLNGSHIPLSTLFERYVFLDNTPIGIKQ